MEFHQLRYFCAVVKAGNFTRAAEEQHVAQPSLSQQILKLEEEFGAKLFDRFPRSARLTPFGRAFLDRAEAILREAGDARTAIREMAGVERGEVNLGAIPTIAPYLLPQALASLARHHPQVLVNVAEEVTPALLERLHHGAIDIAVLALPVPGAGLVSEELVREPLFAALPRDHRLASRKSLDLRELKGEPFLLLKEEHCFRENAIAACRRSRVQPKIVFESGHFTSIIAMVSAGIGISVVPGMAVQESIGCRFVKIRDAKSSRRVGLVRLKQHYHTRAERALVECLRAAAGTRKVNSESDFADE